MKIAMVVPNLERGGGVPSVARFVKAFAGSSAGCEIQLISLATSATDECSVRLLAPLSWVRGVHCRQGLWEGTPYVHVGSSLTEFEFQRYKSRPLLTEILRQSDIIQVICGSAAWANAVLGTGRPTSVYVATRAKVERRLRDARPQGLKGLWRKAMTPITDRLDERALRSVDAIQVMNPWMLDYAKTLNSNREIDLRYAPPGINARQFVPSSARGAVDRPYILCVGRLEDPRKNIALLLEAYALLPDALRSKVHLKIAGSSGPPQAFWDRVAALDLSANVEFNAKPDRDTLVKLYQRASVFVLPSDEEGFGMVLLEAMACGVPVVSTRSGGPDAIVSDGENGFLVPLNDAVAIADRLGRLLDDGALNVSMGRLARATIETRYAEEVAGNVFVEVWKGLLAKRERSKSC